MKRLITIILVLLTCSFAIAQKKNKKEAEKPADPSQELMRFAGNIHQFNSIFPQEKVYLEFDNTAYFQGETIWFKAFVTHATTLKRAPSKVLYVDFIAPTGHVIERQKLKIVAGQCDGAIILVDAATTQARERRGMIEYPSGFYEIRAYTQNMLDFDKETIFSRVIPVYVKPKRPTEFESSFVVLEQENPLIRNIRDEAEEKNHKIDLMLFPEGGDLIEGLPCKVAFKATGKDALAIDGYVLWGNKDTARTVHDGMGSFVITPGGSESVSFVTLDGKSSRFSLPRVLKSGYSMMATSISDTLINVSIRRTPDRIGEPAALAVTCRGELVFFKEIEPRDSVELSLGCALWPLGVCRMTLYDKKGMILSSRSLFHNNDMFRSPTITLLTDSLSRQPFGKQVLSLKLTDREGNPMRDRFCLSVRDVDDFGTGMSDNLMSNLLLSSDLKGYIHDPAWYLEANDPEHRDALNLLTLVQGWERYEWQYMTGQKYFSEKHRIEDSLTMNGWVLSYAKRKPVNGVDVYASVVPGDKSKFESFKYHTDTTGYFGFDLSDFYGKAKMTISLMTHRRNGKTKYETSTRIKFERSDMPDSRSLLKQEIDLSRNNRKVVDPTAKDNGQKDDGLPLVINEDLGIMLDDVEITEERRFVDYDTFTSWDVEKDAEMELDMGEYTTDVMGYFLEKGITFEEHQPFFYIHNQEKVLDKKPFDDPMSIDMIDVKSIIVYDDGMYPRHFTEFTPLLFDYHRSRGETSDFVEWIYNSWDKYRLVDILIKNDRDLLSYKEIRNLSRRITTVDGFSTPVEYYGPQYPEGPVYGDVDTRRTVYWNPNVITDKNGNARVEFYNNSFSRHYTISGAGITPAGTPFILNENW
jgi:hypothetical protein